MVAMTRQGGADSAVGQEAEMENKSMEATVQESPCCRDLEPVSR